MGDVPGRLTRAIATGSIQSTPGLCRGFILSAGSDAATAVFRTEGAGGAAVLTLKAAAGTSVPFPTCAIPFADLHVTLTGTGPEVSVLI
jgi:hypothetical protein